MTLFSLAFNMEDPEGQGTEDRINLLVEVLKGLALLIRVVVIPAIRNIAFVIKMVLMPLRVVLTVIKAILTVISMARNGVGAFTEAWTQLTNPLRMVFDFLKGISDMVNQVSDAIKNSVIGKLLGWDKESNGEDNAQKVDDVRSNLYDNMKTSVQGSNMDFVTKQTIMSELNSQSISKDHASAVQQLGRTYNNNNNNQKQVVINNNFSEGSMPIDARNMTKNEARKMFIGAFGYRRAVGYNGILR